MNGEMQGKLARSNAEREAWGHERQAEMSKYNAKVARSQKKGRFDMIMTSVFSNSKGIGQSWDAYKNRPQNTTIATGPSNASLPIQEQGPITNSTAMSEYDVPLDPLAERI